MSLHDQLHQDLAVFTNAADFGVSAVLDGVVVQGIFDAAYSLSGIGSGGFSTAQPALLVSTQQVPANPVGLFVQIGVQRYSVQTHEPDGTGLSTLLLQYAPPPRS